MPTGLSEFLTVASALLSAGIFVIQLMTRNEVLKSKLEIMSHVDQNFASKDRVDGLADRLEALENRRNHATAS